LCAKSDAVALFDEDAGGALATIKLIDRSARDFPKITSPADSVANMRVIDRVYEKSGLPLRGGGGSVVKAASSRALPHGEEEALVRVSPFALRL
jgi:hypothetical protein